MDDRNVIDEFTKTYHKTEDSRVGQQTRLDQQTQLRQARLRRAQSRQAQYRARVAQASSNMATGQGQFGPAGPQPPQPNDQPHPKQPERPQKPQKPHKCHKCAITIISLIIGIVLGGVGVYALTYFLAKPAPQPECNCPEPAPAASLNNLDYDFLKLESASDNIIYSPLSIKNGLALLDAGAASETKAEIDKVLSDTEIPKYQNIPDTLSLANAVFIRDTFQSQVLPTYASTVTNDYGAEVIYDNFESSANMDNWVGQKTFGLINNIGIIPNPDTEMVLANALAIQMDWRYKFDANSTSGATFSTKSGETIEATTMTETFNNPDIQYNTSDDATVVTLPLNSGSEAAQLEFVAIMPTGNIDEYINNLDNAAIETALSDLIPANTNVDGLKLSIPKFKFDYSLNFKNDLESLGITQAFTPNADFSNMATANLYVSDAIHKANIDFSEDGIKAAAVTVSAMASNALAAEPQPTIIKIDHPFLFLIRDKANNATWFTGVVCQPNLWANDAATYQQS